MRPLRATALSTLAIALACAASIAHAQQQVLPAKSEIAFVTTQMGVPVEGKFLKWSAQVAFDPKHPETSRVAFTVDTASASFGAPELDGEVPKAAWFSAAKFPQATFQSTAIRASGPGRFAAVGKLQIKGVTKEVIVPLTMTQSGTPPAVTTLARGTFNVQRLDFKIGEGEWADTSMVANEVQVKFTLAIAGVPPL